MQPIITHTHTFTVLNVDKHSQPLPIELIKDNKLN